MRVSEIGEFGLLMLLTRELGVPLTGSHGAARPGLLVDIGDDALVTLPRPGATVWTTDTLVAGVHFLPERTPWPNTGWKAIAVNVSDIAAMGGTPDFALVTLNLPPDFCVEDAVELYRGMKECCEAFGVTIGGGDIVRAPVFSVTVALSGRAEGGEGGEALVLRRNAAQAGDSVAVTGHLGDAAAGLRLLLEGGERGDATSTRLVEAQERPMPRVAAGLNAVRAGIRCGMDISDGLVQDLGHIAEAGGLAARIEAKLVPLSEQLRRTFPDEALDMALTGGEDYELLLCGPRGTLERLIVEGLDLTIVGEMVEGPPGVTVVAPDGSERPYTDGGWDHFRGGRP